MWEQGALDALIEFPLAREGGRLAWRADVRRLGQRVTTALRLVTPDGGVRAFEWHRDEGLVALDPRWHQAALSFLRSGIDHVLTGPDHLRRALFATWDYADERPSLRWDPADYRPHALRAEDPSGDPIRTMRGANRLAVEALPLFATVPGARELFTVGFANRDGSTEITWPIWVEALDLDTIHSMLSLTDLQKANAEVLRRRGVAQAFRATRFTDGKYRNFSPARALL